MKLIDKGALILHLNDWASSEAPDERTPDEVKEYTQKDVQEAIYQTIRGCMRAVEDAKTVMHINYSPLSPKEKELAATIRKELFDET